ncbi:MAG: SDR family oxidoreductase [Deltaproteobacteria bacterium]|nr:SDR family oxidoreductase [Deltaproteobacteria bacterium]
MAKIAVVTGGAGDIGKAVVARLAKDGYQIVILDMNQETGKQTVADFAKRNLALDFHCANLADEAAVKNVFSAIFNKPGRVDLLVNVAGGSFYRHKFEDFPLDHWRTIIDANLTSTFLCCRAVTPSMKAQKSGVIINTSSDIAYSGGENRSAYAAAKAGILGLTRTLALELAPNVRVNAVAPGRIETPRVRSHYTEEEWNKSNERIPLGHPGAVQDVAETVAYLASDAAKHMTGQTIHVNGGRIMH